jgi:hypothetical protein
VDSAPVPVYRPSFRFTGVPPRHVRSHPPFALDAPEFRFRALALSSGRASIGGGRELVLAALLGARLIDGVVGPHPLPPAHRRLRAAAARTWLSALALPASSRLIMARLVEATAMDDRRALLEAWENLAALVSPALEGAARNELRRVTIALHSAE